jgi:yeast amino acid transporter
MNTVLTADWRDGNGFRDDYLSTNGGISRLAGFWYCCCQAVYSYGGVTIIGITANEAERQRETLPKAVRRVIHRLFFYYVAATFALGVSLWAKDPLLDSYVNGYYSSPYVIMVRRSGVPFVTNLVNAIVLVACLSTANANLYETVFSPRKWFDM